MTYNDNGNIIIGDPGQLSAIGFRQTPESLLDPDEYSSFVYNIETQFRKSRFYKDYKSFIMQQGICFDQQMGAITSDMTNIEMHHALPTLKHAVISIIESYLKTAGQVNTFMVLHDIEEAHRENMMGVIMLTTTNHQLIETDPSAFISIRQLYGNPFAFLDKYGKFFTMDMAYKWLLQFKLEEQHGGITNWPNIARARQQLLDWSNMGYIQ